ncbi:PI-PLC domain-containing protein [Streptomyces durmitorensis]|uniref:Integral membrane protein n=1 Tax=Streptomyces durmitorensis TaxID=319947 RepID=A0ABY4PQP4_9ACTN|nr:hypothetical protein [Streptomyces durmitorensis]UQT55273.1 hypothetical protein M4V62_09275 [Streptomyces durmitorensis]
MEERASGQRSRRLRRLRPVAWVVAVLCVAVLATTATARGTVLSPGFHQGVLKDQHAYDRLYNEVLVDPQSLPVARDLLGRLPVPEAAVTSNLKIVLPPETLRAMADRQIEEVTGYLRGEHDTLRLTADLRPVLTNVGDLAQTYFGDLVASVQRQPEPDFPAFLTDLNSAARSVTTGEPPTGLPALELSREQAVTAARALLQVVPEDRRDALRPEVEVAMESGDVASALAAVGPEAVSDRTRLATEQLRTTVGGDTWDITADLDTSQDALAPLHRARSVTHLAQEVVEPIAALLGVAALAFLWFSGPRAPARRLMGLGWALAAGGLLTGLAALFARAATDDGVITAPASWPQSLARLVDDVGNAALDGIIGTATATAYILLAAGALLVTVSWVWQAGPALTVSPRRVQVLAVGVAGAALGGVVLAPLAVGRSEPRACQGSARLCDRPYDEIAQLTSHNAMSTTADQFIGPLQDPGITAQLNDGVRALQIDTYTWEGPEQIAERLKGSDFSPRLQGQIKAAINKFNPPRDGLWLCHSVCRAGAIGLVPTLRETGDWLRAHPTDVVTLIVQDAVGADDTAAAFEEAGLTDLLFTPDPDPDEPWPELGDMIDSGRRLVVFAEREDGPQPWYRNFYRYGMETPFAFRSPADMTCAPHRGGEDKRLFLLNHFITIDGGSRLDAGTVNRREAVLDRVHDCERQRGRPVNFVAVDYLNIGDARGAVDALNAER